VPDFATTFKLTITELACSIAVETISADLAVESFGVEQTLLALSGVGIAVAGRGYVDVIVALASLARAPGDLRVAVVVVGADVAVTASVLRGAVAHDVVGLRVQHTRVGERVAGLLGPGARTRTARNVHAKARIAVVTHLAPNQMLPLQYC